MPTEENFKSEKHKPLTLAQKLIVGVLILATIVVLFLGLKGFKGQVSAPFKFKDTETDGQKTDETEQDSDIVNLQKKDTDEDGLSDYDEMYIYKTSPYLEDSDSDGISDKVEIETGDDPTCKQGDNCGITDPEIVEQTSDLKKQQELQEEQDFQAELFDLTSDLSDLNNLNTLSGEADISSLLSDDLSIDNIKNLLREAGMDDEFISQFSDEQLISVYKDTLGKMKSE